MSIPLPQLTLTGNVYPSKMAFASVGDVAIHPGATRTSFIDATVFDGATWRALDLGGFGVRKGDRGFDHSGEIGAVMRQIAQTIAGYRGAPVHYEIPASGKRRKYVYRGIPLGFALQGRQYFF